MIFGRAFLTFRKPFVTFRKTKMTFRKCFMTFRKSFLTFKMAFKSSRRAAKNLGCRRKTLKNAVYPRRDSAALPSQVAVSIRAEGPAACHTFVLQGL
jgi:hypothetical protein